jgi:hypothetical protein
MGTAGNRPACQGVECFNLSQLESSISFKAYLPKMGFRAYLPKMGFKAYLPKIGFKAYLPKMGLLTLLALSTM